MPLAPGTHLGPYEILAPLGAGGMGEVYRVRDPRMGREVAIKVAAEQFSERFSREVHAVAALNHPNVCHIHDVGPNYLVMELIEGPTLAERIRQGPVPYPDVLAIAKQIIAALEAAHNKGIVHRDLKPANIKLTPDGVVKVLDFGLAKIADPAEAARTLENSPTLTFDPATRAGEIMGTAAYMSPEQARGKSVDKRADIWAFGVVLYELLTGERLFKGSDTSEILASVIKEEPKFERIPPQLRRLLEKCLAKDPNDRLRDIGDAWLFLGDAPAEKPAVAQALAPKALWIGAGLLLIALIAVSFLYLREVPAPQRAMRLMIVMPEDASVLQFALSPDGSTLAITTIANGKRHLWLRAIDSDQAQPVSGTDDASYPFWSPDSRYVGFFADGKLKKVLASGGPPSTLCDSPDGRGGTWNSAGVILFSTVEGGGFGIRRVSSEGGTSELLVRTAKGIARFPQFLPDGLHFLYLVTRASAEENGIYYRTLDGKENRRVLNDESGFFFAGGRLLFIREDTLMTQRFDPGSGQIKGDPAPIAPGVRLTSNVSYAPVTASNDGILVYETGGIRTRSAITWYDRSGKTYTSQENFGGQPAISPDEKSVAFMRLTPSGSDLWLWDLSRGTVQLMHKDPTFAQVPLWSPKSDRIAFESNRTAGVPNLYTTGVNGTGQEVEIFSSNSRKLPTQWSRDGRFIVYSESDTKTRDDLWVLPIENGKAGKPVSFLHSEFNETYGQLSPSGRWMAYTSDESGRREVYLRSFPSGEEPKRISIDGGDQPRWRGDEKELYFIGTDSKVMAVSIKAGSGAQPTLEAGPPQLLFTAPPLFHYTANAYDYDVTLDGKRFLLNVSIADTAGARPLNLITNWEATLKK